jgi:uncharacterized protein
LKRLSALSLIILSLLLCINSFAYASYPAPTAGFFVNDFANVIDSQTEAAIQAAGVELQNRTGAQVVVVTMDTIDNQVLEQYSLGLLREWGIGQKDVNNGVLMLVVVNDRQSRIEVGYGLEGALPDARTGRIQDDYMLPYFREGNYSTGIAKGYAALLEEVYREYGIEPGTVQPGTGTEGEYNPPGVNQTVLIIIAAIVLVFDWIFLRGRITRFLFFMAMMGGRRGGRGGGGGFRGGGGFGGGGGSSRRW